MAKDDRTAPDTAPSKDSASTEAEQPKRYDPKAATPEEHARATGQVEREEREPITINGERSGPAYTWQHAAAAALHGWNHHKLHDAEPLLITQDAYKAALKAVEAPVAHAVNRKSDRRVLAGSEKPGAEESLSHDYVPHAGALSKHFAKVLPKHLAPKEQ